MAAAAAVSIPLRAILYTSTPQLQLCAVDVVRAVPAGWGTILVMIDVVLSVFSVILYIAMTYHPINVSSSCASSTSLAAGHPPHKEQQASRRFGAIRAASLVAASL